MRIIIVEPGKPAREGNIEYTLKALQAVVGGPIEPFHPFQDNVCCLCNEEGQFMNLPPNRALVTKSGQVAGIIAGTFFICGESGSDYCSLSDEQVDKYLRRCNNPDVNYGLPVSQNKLIIMD